ncbi:synaptic glycoprotein SC2 [Terfezia claveryi]|nr:synaptic glycoprotein SC2 [Terfezia claveryi]
MSVTINLKSRGRPIKHLPTSVDVNPKSTPSELAGQISSKTGLSIHRLRLTKASDGKVLEDLNISSNETVYVKDLGPQIGWRTVFVIEYLGPLLIHPLFFIPKLRTYIYPHLQASIASIPPTPYQRLLLYLILIHFLKRELETLFVHKFSSATMPWRNLPKNSTHYWILSGMNLAWFLYHPLVITEGKYTFYTPSSTAILTLTALWVFAQLSNFSAHLTLSNLRPAGTTTRGIPRGYGFNWVTCPNYFFEVLGWLAVWALSGFNWAVGLFTLVSAGQMYLWAVKKENRYRKEFGDKYKKKRAVLIPALL